MSRRARSALVVAQVAALPFSLSSVGAALCPDGLSPHQNDKDLAISEAELLRVAGHYAQGETKLEIRAEGGRLMAYGLGKPTRVLFQGGGEFRLESSPDFKVRFPGADSKAEAMTVMPPGGSLTLSRVASGVHTIG